MLDHRAPLSHIFDPQPTIVAAVWKITVTEQQHDADEGNPTTTTASTADGLLTHGRHHGSAAEGEAAEEKEEKESSATVHYTHCKTDNDTTAECGQLTGNEGATLRATPKFDKDMLLLRPPRHFWGECPTHKRKPTASKAATALERRRTRAAQR